jgi:3',5'-cyclic AMP phosphodiesterase CpdA
MIVRQPKLGSPVDGRAAVSPIWNLRRGDDEDNRTSLYGRGLRRVLLSGLLEFNVLKASIGFLVLIIGPALLIGLAPSLIIYLGRFKLHLIRSTPNGLILTVISLIVLGGLALWIGRPFLRKGVDSFWHLHYTLVFPVFVILRELLRTITERFPRRPVSLEDLDRRRRIGSVLAALILGGAGVLLAYRVELKFGLQIVDAGHFRPWPVAMAAFGNAAVILGCSTLIESLYWLWRELAIPTVVRNWTSQPTSEESPLARIAHLSDLHFVGERYGCRMETGAHGPRGNRSIRKAFRKLTAIDAATPLDHILLTGDITDAGTRAEWAEFIDLLRSFPDLRSRMSFVPGNHDVNIVDRTNPGRPDLPGSTGRSLRKLRVLVALDALVGDRAHLVDSVTGALGPSLGEYLREGERVPRLRSLAQDGTLRGRREMARVWEAVFPLVEPPNRHGCGVILLDSNARSHFSLTNALGVVSRSQLRALRLLLANSRNASWLILLHHQVVEYPITSISLRDRIGLALLNAPDVLAAIAPHAARVIIMHGHRHIDWVGTYSVGSRGSLVLCSAPSVTLGSQDGDGCQGSFHINEFAAGTDGGIHLASHQRVRVP